MQFFTGLTTLLFATLALGAAIDTRAENGVSDVDQGLENAACSPKGGACVTGQLGCCPGLSCFIPPKSGWEPQGAWDYQGACI
jgi:hypothetical protein